MKLGLDLGSVNSKAVHFLFNLCYSDFRGDFYRAGHGPKHSVSLFIHGTLILLFLSLQSRCHLLISPLTQHPLSLLFMVVAAHMA